MRGGPAPMPKKGPETHGWVFYAVSEATSTEDARLVTLKAYLYRSLTVAALLRSSAENSCVAERITARLRIHTQPVRFMANGNAREELAVARIDRVNLRVIPAGEP
jgi:hypothetical protein